LDKETHDASRPNFGRIFFPSRRGGRLLKGAAGITAIVVITRRKVSIIKIFRILDDISNLFLLF
jgi:hypothetical protein